MTDNHLQTFRGLDEDATVRAILEGTATATGERFFAALVENLSGALNTYSSWVTEYIKEVHVPSENVPQVLRKSDIFVLPTLSEGTPRVVIEAKANCVPVIASNVGGLPDSIINGKDGLLVSPKNPKEIASSIEILLNDTVLRKEIINNAYNSTTELTIENFVSNINNRFNGISGQ